MSARVTIKGENLEYAKSILAGMPQQIERASKAAVRRTMQALRTRTSVEIRREYTAKAKDIKKTFRLRYAGTSGELISTGKTLSLSQFKVKRRRRGPMRVAIKKAGGMKPLRGLFQNEGRLMLRTTRERYPVYGNPQGPSVPQMFGNKDVLGELVPFAEQKLNERFLHEVNYRFGRMAAK